MITEMEPKELMDQAFWSANRYMKEAVKHIDELFGEGFAKENPELVGQFMLTAAQDFQTSMEVRESQLRRNQELENLSR